MFTFTEEGLPVAEFTETQLRDTMFSHITLNRVARSNEYRQWINDLRDNGIYASNSGSHFLAGVAAHEIDMLFNTYYAELSSGVRVSTNSCRWNINPIHFVSFMLGDEIDLIVWDRGSKITQQKAVGTRMIPAPEDEVAPVEVPDEPIVEENWEDALIDSRDEPIVEVPTEAVELERAFGPATNGLDEMAKNRLLAILRENKSLSTANLEQGSRIYMLSNQVRATEEQNSRGTNLGTKALITIAELARTFPLSESRSMTSYYSTGVQHEDFRDFMKEMGLRLDSSELRRIESDYEEVKTELATVVGNIASQEGWCPEYDSMARLFGWPDREELGIEPAERDFDVNGYVDLRVPISWVITASNEEDALENIGNYYGSQDMAEQVMNTLGVNYTREIANALTGYIEDVTWEEANEI